MFLLIIISNKFQYYKLFHLNAGTNAQVHNMALTFIDEANACSLSMRTDVTVGSAYPRVPALNQFSLLLVL